MQVNKINNQLFTSRVRMDKATASTLSDVFRVNEQVKPLKEQFLNRLEELEKNGNDDLVMLKYAPYLKDMMNLNKGKFINPAIVMKVRFEQDGNIYQGSSQYTLFEECCDFFNQRIPVYKLSNIDELYKKAKGYALLSNKTDFEKYL